MREVIERRPGRGRASRAPARLTMSSGLADLDPYYDLDLRAAALDDTRIAGPPGQRFHYNNVQPGPARHGAGADHRPDGLGVSVGAALGAAGHGGGRLLVRFGTGCNDDHWSDLLATLARRI
jgi:hypothetical protein